jgi:hypothetical protein
MPDCLPPKNLILFTLLFSLFYSYSFALSLSLSLEKLIVQIHILTRFSKLVIEFWSLSPAEMSDLLPPREGE